MAAAAEAVATFAAVAAEAVKAMTVASTTQTRRWRLMMVGKDDGLVVLIAEPNSRQGDNYLIALFGFKQSVRGKSASL